MRIERKGRKDVGVFAFTTCSMFSARSVWGLGLIRSLSDLGNRRERKPF